MKHSISIQKLLLAFFLVSSIVTGAPQLAFPINSQVPPIAYASQPYSFIFAATTFVSSAPQISYTITDGPKWLDLDSTSRQFAGIPELQDVGATTFQLIASDLTGQTSTSVTFVVAASSELSSDTDILSHLGQSGTISAPNSLLLHPQEAFELSFREDTFSGVSSGTRYYAVSADNTPLPSWVQFDVVQGAARDTTQLLFSGTTPVLLSSMGGPQTYQLRLLASNVAGFAESAVDFNLVISPRLLGFSDASQTITIWPGVPFESSPFRPFLTLDGHAVANSQLANVEANAPAWVEFDVHRLSLTGTPDAAINAAITMSVTDIYGDTANATIFLQITDNRNVSLGTIATLNISAGEYFSYNLVTPSFSPAIRAIPDLSEVTSWVNFDAVSWTLSGVVPLDQAPQTVDVPITFENATSTVTGEVILQVLQKTEAPAFTPTHFSRTYAPAIPSVTSIASEPTISPGGPRTSNRHVLRTVLAIVFSFVGACVVLLLILCYLRRRKCKRRGTSKNSTEDTPEPVEDHTATESSGPIVLSPEMVGVATPQTIAPLRQPGLDLAWSSGSIRHSTQRLSGTSRPGPLSYHRISQTFTRERDLLGRAGTIAAPKGMAGSAFEPVNVGDEMLPQHPPSAIINRHSKIIHQNQNRSSTRISRRSILPPLVGLPDRRSGAGHGSGILLGPADGASSRMSWRNSWTSNPSTDLRTTAVLDSFPSPPGDGPDLAGSPSRAKASIPLLRVVSEDSDKAMSFEEQRQKWHTERARARLEGASRFSNAGSTRMVPSPRTVWRVRSDRTAGNRDLSVSMIKPYANGSSREHSWSKWSGVGPAAHEVLQVESPSGSVNGHNPMLRSRPSVASSRQFESVTSSDSQWEDAEDLVMEETGQGIRQWQTDKSSQASPRLPFSPVRASRENLTNRSVSDHAEHQTRVVDRRKHISVEEGHLQRSYGSQRGSFRFI